MIAFLRELVVQSRCLVLGHDPMLEQSTTQWKSIWRCIRCSRWQDVVR